MNKEEIYFVVTLKKLICNLQKYKSDYDIDNIKNLFISNISILKENDLLNSVINELITLSEKNITIEDADSFVENISQYWFNLIENSKFHIVFYGDHENFLTLTNDLKDKKTDIDYIDADSPHAPVFLKDTYPVAIYDDKGSSILKTKEKNAFLDYIYHPFNSIQNKQKPIILDYVKYLVHEYKKTKSIKNIVTGSSHGWHAVPASFTTITSNLSMHSGDLTYASSIINHLESHSIIYNYLHIVSPFELFYELSLSKHLFNKQILNSIRAFCKINSISYNDSLPKKTQQINYSQNATSGTNSITSPIADILINILINKKKQNITDSHFFDKDIGILNKSITSELLPKHIIKILNSTDYQPKELACKNSIARGKAHSKQYERKNSFEVNKKNVTKIIESVKKQKSTIHFIIPPYPRLYISNIDKKMFADTINFYKSCTDNTSVYFLDYSNDNDFIQSDFLDGDHLNFNGAMKFISKLSDEGIIV